ncbi:GNAT family N-acetyltransferase [Dongia sp.]|uniref:GNAT family N-acetyltransferase n=1 Tax=Dongia sp. TaxID=1977262 RepID=UPI0035B29BE3
MTALPTPDIRSLKYTLLKDRSVALKDFECGESTADRNIDKCCEWQSMHRARVFCAHMDGIEQAYGFYCLGILAQDPGGMDADIVRAGEGRKFVPFIYVHYIGVRREFQNQNIGTMLLGNLLERCGMVVRNVGVFGVALNALTPEVAKLYHKYGFRQRDERKYPLMILPSQSLIELTGG